MRRELLLIASLSAVPLTLVAQTPARDGAPPATVAGAAGQVRGRVVILDTDTPIRRARVTLATASGPPLDSTYSDSEGRFEFLAVPPGHYTAAAWKSGYAETRFGARNAFDRPTPLVIIAGGRVDGLVLPLAKGAAISGRVLDDYGDPMVGVSVRAGRLASVNGRPRFETVGLPVDTDDLGEYRIGGLPAGTFIVSAFGWPPAPRFPVPPSLRGGVLMGPPAYTMFYPGSGFITQARTIALRAGDEASAIDVTFSGQSTTKPRVSVRVSDPEGRTMNSVMFSASSDGSGISDAGLGLNMIVPPGGEFSVALNPGEYLFLAQTDTGVAMQHVSVGENDIAGLQLVIAKGARIAGRVVFEGAAPRPAGRLSVEAWSSESLQGVAINRNAPDIGPVGRVSGGGTFEIIKVSGTRTLRVNQLPSGWVVKSITAAGRDLMDVPIEFKSGEDLRDVVIVLSDRETEVTGTVTDEQRAPASGVSVLIFPDDKRRLPARARWLRPDSSGNFTVSGLPPGDYFAALAEDIDDLQWTDAAYLDRFREQATPFRLGDAEHKMLPLRWSAPR